MNKLGTIIIILFVSTLQAAVHEIINSTDKNMELSFHMFKLKVAPEQTRQQIVNIVNVPPGKSTAEWKEEYCIYQVVITDPTGKKQAKGAPLGKQRCLPLKITIENQIIETWDFKLQ